MKIYTKTGDKGTTALFGGTRVPKHHIRIDSYGTVDELNSHLGLIRDQDINNHYKDVLIDIQDKLFTVGAILATDPEKATLKNGKQRLNIPKISEADILRLEQEMDTMNAELPPMTHFCIAWWTSNRVILSHCSLCMPQSGTFGQCTQRS